VTPGPGGVSAAPVAARPAWPWRLYAVVASGRLAVALIATLVALLLVYLLVPQNSSAGAESVRAWVARTGAAGRAVDAVGLTDVRRSLVLWIALGLLFANLFFCMIRRLRSAILTARMPERAPVVTPHWTERSVRARSAAPEELSGLLRHRGYSVRRFDGGVYGVSGRFAHFGSWIFHTGILALMVAGALVALRPDPFRGAAGVGEGESFDIHTSAFLGTNAPVAESLSPLAFEVENVEVATEHDDVRAFETRIVTEAGGRAAIGVNRPYRAAPYQVLGIGFGYMPGWAIVDRRGRMVRGAWVKLAPFPHDAEETIAIGPRTSSVRFRFLPDGEDTDGAGPGGGREPGKAAFRAKVELRGNVLHDGLLAPGERVKLEEGLWFFFLPDVRRYALLEIREEAGHAGVFASFGVIIAGLFLRYGRIRKEVLLRSEGGLVHAFGRSEILESLFEEEMDSLAAAMSSTEATLAAREATT